MSRMSTKEVMKESEFLKERATSQKRIRVSMCPLDTFVPIEKVLWKSPKSKLKIMVGGHVEIHNKTELLSIIS
jgi:hypothetical protein